MQRGAGAVAAPLPAWTIRGAEGDAGHAACTLQEWMTPQPSRRPDPMPEFEKLETPLPRKLPGDPEVYKCRQPSLNTVHA